MLTHPAQRTAFRQQLQARRLGLHAALASPIRLASRCHSCVCTLRSVPRRGNSGVAVCTSPAGCTKGAEGCSRTTTFGHKSLADLFYSQRKQPPQSQYPLLEPALGDARVGRLDEHVPVVSGVEYDYIVGEAGLRHDLHKVTVRVDPGS